MHWALVALCVFAIIVLVAGIAAVIYRYASPITSPAKIRDGVYRILNRFHQLCEGEQIRYAITCGTLLGAVRHKSIIPIDDDGDIVVDDETRLVPKVFAKYGLELHRREGEPLWKVHMKNTEAHMDIFVVRETSSGRWEYAEAWARSRWPTEYFESDELWPSQLLEFGPLRLHAPSKPERFLERAYGERWNKEMKITSLHHGGWSRYLKWYRTVRPQTWKAYPPSEDCADCFPPKEIHAD